MFVALCGLSLVVAGGGCSSLCCMGVSRRGGFSCCSSRAQARGLWAVGCNVGPAGAVVAAAGAVVVGCRTCRLGGCSSQALG